MNTLREAQGVLAHFDGATTLGWGAKRVLDESVQIVRALTNGIAQAGLTQQEMATHGFTLDKDNQLLLVGKLTLTLIYGLRPLAKKTNDRGLLEKVDFEPSTVTRGPALTVANRCQLIHDLAKERMTVLEDFGVSQAHLDAQQVAIDTFKPLVGLRDTMSAKRQAATARIPVMDKQLREQLDILDDLTQNLIDDTDFKAAYRELRNRVDTRKRGKAKKEDGNGEPAAPAPAPQG